jgi:transketolase
MRVFTPAFGSDVPTCLKAALSGRTPSYLRLGKSVKDFGTITPGNHWSGFRRVVEGSKIVLAVMGPVVENVISTLGRFEPGTIDLWVVSEFPIARIPEEFKNSLMSTKRLVTVEEHYRSGGLCESLAPLLLDLPSIHSQSLHATGYPSGLYGSQQWHQGENNLGESGIQQAILGTLAA